MKKYTNRIIDIFEHTHKINLPYEAQASQKGVYKRHHEKVLKKWVYFYFLKLNGKATSYRPCNTIVSFYNPNNTH